MCVLQVSEQDAKGFPPGHGLQVGFAAVLRRHFGMVRPTGCSSSRAVGKLAIEALWKCPLRSLHGGGGYPCYNNERLEETALGALG